MLFYTEILTLNCENSSVENSYFISDGFSLSDECCYPLCLAVTFYSPTYFSICLMGCKKIRFLNKSAKYLSTSTI